MQVRAVDADSGINAEITYSIELATNSSLEDTFFVVDSSSGQVRLTSALSSADINSSYVVTVRATDAGTQPLTSSVQLCAVIVDQKESEDQLHSVLHRRLSLAGGLVFDVAVAAVLFIISLFCACVVVVVVSVAVATRRTRRRRLMNRYKNSSHYKLIDIWNGGTFDGDRTEKVQAVNNDNHDVERCSARRFPRTVIRTLDSSPRSSRNSEARTRQSMWQSTYSSAWGRLEPDGRISFNHYDAEPSHNCGSNV